MKRSSSDAGPPPPPRQLQLPAIPVFNQPNNQPSPLPPAILPPTLTTVRRPSVAVWPQPGPAFFTFSANQAYPPGPPGLPAPLPATFHGMRLASLPPNGNAPSTTPSGSTGRYTHSKVNDKTELTVKLATAADLIELADTLRRPTKVTKINVVTWSPTELKATFEAIRTSLTVLDLEVIYEGPMPEARELNRVFSVFQEQQAPIKSFKWVSAQANAKPLEIDQHIFESLLGSQLLERVQFSGPPGNHSTTVIVNDPDRLVLCVQKHQSLKSLLLERINGGAFINAILKGVTNSPLIDEIHLDSRDLTMCSAALQAALTSNTKLRSLSIKGCQLEFGVMTRMLKSIQQHPGLVSLDFSETKIPDEELQMIGEPIGELLVTNSQIKTLGFRCTLSPANVTALEIGLSANTSLGSVIMALEDDMVFPN